jgi:hypothetical protein
LGGDFLFLSNLESTEALFHLNLKFERGFILEQVKVGFMG